jgi:hypothetical protein
MTTHNAHQLAVSIAITVLQNMADDNPAELTDDRDIALVRRELCAIAKGLSAVHSVHQSSCFNAPPPVENNGLTNRAR